MIHAPPLGTGQRVSADEDRRRARLPLDGLDDLPLRAARIGHQHVAGRRFGRAAHVVGDPADRRADDHDVGVGHAGLQVGRAAVDRTQTHGQVERGLVAADADDLRRERAVS